MPCLKHPCGNIKKSNWSAVLQTQHILKELVCELWFDLFVCHIVQQCLPIPPAVLLCNCCTPRRVNPEKAKSNLNDVIWTCCTLWKMYVLLSSKKQAIYLSVFQWNLYTKEAMLYCELYLILFCLILHGQQSCTWFVHLYILIGITLVHCNCKVENWLWLLCNPLFKGYTNKCWSCHCNM